MIPTIMPTMILIRAIMMIVESVTVNVMEASARICMNQYCKRKDQAAICHRVKE
jgi:hypothetical protein